MHTQITDRQLELAESHSCRMFNWSIADHLWSWASYVLFVFATHKERRKERERERERERREREREREKQRETERNLEGARGRREG